jgi:peptidoglycan/LPS O-acetylase OafA/YrhL
LTTTTAPTTTTKRPPRIQLNTLTGLRGILQFTVFGFHASIAYVLSEDISNTIIRYDVGPGEAVLSFFFMLSGFVLVWVARPGEARRLFWRRRVVKIFPNHVVTWTAGLILMIAFGIFTSWGEVLPSLILIQSWIPIEGVLAGTNGPAWSLSCELFFYGLFPFLLAWGMKKDGRHLWRWVIGLAAGIIAFTALVGLTVPSEPKALGQDVSAYQFYILIFHPLVRLLDFTIGVLVARIVITGQWRPIRTRWTWILLGIGWAISLNLPNPLGFVAPFVPGLILMLGGAATADINGSTNLFTRRPLVWLGDISFAFYLIHGNVLIYSERAIGQGPYPTPLAVLYIAGVLATSILLAHLLRTRVEDPMMKHWSRPRRRPATSAAGISPTASAGVPVTSTEAAAVTPPEASPARQQPASQQ